MESFDEEQFYVIGDFKIRHLLNSFQQSARAEEIKKRSQLDKQDGQVIDDHDQFYRDHKLLLHLFRVLAVMPVQRKNGRIVFSWFSLTSFYAYAFYAFLTVLIVAVGWERLIILTTKSKKFDEYIYSIIFIIYLVPHFWIPYVGWGVARDVCDYKNSWGVFQLDYFKITGKSLEFPYLSTLIVIVSGGSLIVAIIFILTLSALLEGFTLYHTTAYIHVITMINMNCALWYINCRAIGNASKSVANSFELYLRPNDEQLRDHVPRYVTPKIFSYLNFCAFKDLKENCTAQIVQFYRILWLQLSEILQKLGNAYARTYAANSLFIITNITVAVYGFVSEIVDHGFRFTFKEIGLMVDAGYCSVLFYVFCNCSHKASLNIAKRVQDALMIINLEAVGRDTIVEIELFLSAIRMNPPKVSLQGYTIVNRELLTSSLATIAIYLIVLLQFKISLVKNY